MEKFEELKTAAVEHDDASDKLTEAIEELYNRNDIPANLLTLVEKVFLARAIEQQKATKLKDAIQVFFAPNEV